MKQEVSNTIIKVTNNITMFFNVTSTTSAENCQVVLFRTGMGNRLKIKENENCQVVLFQTGTRNRLKTKENACQAGSSQQIQ